MTFEFAEQLRRLRLRAGMTQEQVAERSGLAVRTVRRLETGLHAGPRHGTVQALADALDLEPAQRETLFAAAGVVLEQGTGDDIADPPVGIESYRLAELAHRLALVVRTRLRDEELLRIHDPVPLPVRWRPARGALIDTSANISMAGPGRVARPVPLVGESEQLATLYRRIPSGRLVVLGRAGSGKTVLARRFVLELVQARTATERVPVLFGLGSWDPATTPFRAWLTDRLERDYPGLAGRGSDATSPAAELVAAGLVLPVVDGFDEIAGDRRRAALAELNATTLPLLLTSRVEEYAAEVAASAVLTSSTAVELEDLTAADLADYLPRTANRRAAGPLWEPVLTEVRANPRDALATVLTTPLMVGLARTVYSDGPGRDPAELLDRGRFPTAEAIERHLLGGLVPAAYRRETGPHRSRDAERWFRHLARWMNRLGTRDLAWWRLGEVVRPVPRALLISVAAGLVFTAAGSVVGWLGATPAAGLPFAVAAGLVLGLAHAVAGTTGIRLSRLDRGAGSFLLSRFLIGLALAAVPAITAGRELLAWVGVGVVVLGVLLTAAFQAPAGHGSAASPRASLGASRRVAVLQTLWVGLVFGMVVGFAHGLRSGLVLGLAGALGFVLTTHGRWLVVARVWLPLTGRLPWAVIGFLEDAHGRGILRQEGACYRFRHDQLRDHLARVGWAPDDEAVDAVPRRGLRPRHAVRGRGAGPRVPVLIGAVGPAVAVTLSLTSARPFASVWGLAVPSTGVFVTVVVGLTAGQLLVQWATLWLAPAAVDPEPLESLAGRAREDARDRERRWQAEHRRTSLSERTRWDRPDEWDDRRHSHDHHVEALPGRGLLIGSSAVEAATGAARSHGVVVDALWPRLARVVPPGVRRHIAWLDHGIAFFRVVLASAVAATAVLAASGSFAFTTIPALLAVVVVFVVRPQVGDVYEARADASDLYRADLLRALRLPAPDTHDGLVAMGDRLMGAPLPDGPIPSRELTDGDGRPARGFRPEEVDEITERLGELVADETRRGMDHLFARLAAERDLTPGIELAERDARRLVDDITDRATRVLDARLEGGFRELRARLGEELSKLVDDAMAGPELVDFAGYLVVELGGGDGVARTGTGVITARPGSSLAVVVSVVADDASWDAAPDRLTTSDAFLALETVQVDGGRVAPEVAFDVIADSATMNARPHRVPVRVARPQGERRVAITLDLPGDEDRHEVWLQLFQAGRLVQAVAITVDARSEAG